jgi:hypothetical protein
MVNAADSTSLQEGAAQATPLVPEYRYTSKSVRTEVGQVDVNWRGKTADAIVNAMSPYVVVHDVNSDHLDKSNKTNGLQAEAVARLKSKMVPIAPEAQKPSFGQTIASVIGLSDAKQNYATQMAARQSSVNQVFDAVDEYQKTTQEHITAHPTSYATTAQVNGTLTTVSLINSPVNPKPPVSGPVVKKVVPRDPGTVVHPVDKHPGSATPAPMKKPVSGPGAPITTPVSAPKPSPITTNPVTEPNPQSGTPVNTGDTGAASVANPEVDVPSTAYDKARMQGMLSNTWDDAKNSPIGGWGAGGAPEGTPGYGNAATGNGNKSTTSQPLAAGKQLGVEKFPSTTAKSTTLSSPAAAERGGMQGGMPGGGAGAKKSENKTHKDRYWMPESMMDESEYDHGLPTPMETDDPEGRAAEIDRQRRERTDG